MHPAKITALITNAASLLNTVAHGLGFSYAPSLLFMFAIGFLVATVLHLSWELSRVEARLRLLAERIATGEEPGQSETDDP